MTPNNYDGLEIGQYKVIGNGCFVIPRQYGCTIVTFMITIGPALTQLLFVNEGYKEFNIS